MSLSSILRSEDHLEHSGAPVRPGDLFVIHGRGGPWESMKGTRWQVLGGDARHLKLISLSNAGGDFSTDLHGLREYFDREPVSINELVAAPDLTTRAGMSAFAREQEARVNELAREHSPMGVDVACFRVVPPVVVGPGMLASFDSHEVGDAETKRLRKEVEQQARIIGTLEGALGTMRQQMRDAQETAARLAVEVERLRRKAR